MMMITMMMFPQDLKMSNQHKHCHYRLVVYRMLIDREKGNDDDVIFAGSRYKVSLHTLLHTL